MYEGKERSEWSRTSLLATNYINCNREKGKPLIDAEIFNPYALKKEKAIINDTEMGFKALKSLVKKKGNKNGNGNRNTKQ